MVASMSSPFISEEIAIKNISIFIFVLSRTMFESILEPAFKKKLIVSIEFPSSMEGIVPPLSLISEIPIELIHSKTNPLTSLKLTIVLIPIFVDSFPLTMREGISPKPHILNNVIFLFGLISEHSFTIKLAFPELSLVPGPMGKLVDTMAILFVIEPISGVRIAVGPGICAITVLQFVAELSFVLVPVAKIQSVPHIVQYEIIQNQEASPTVFWIYARSGGFLAAKSRYIESIEFSIIVSLLLLKLYLYIIDWCAFQRLLPEKQSYTNSIYLYSVCCTITNLPVPSWVNLKQALF